MSSNPSTQDLSGNANQTAPNGKDRNADLHGFVPDSCTVALLLIDVINDLEFDGGEKLLPHALPMAKRLATLKKRAHEAKIPVVYVNDNMGRWQSDFHAVVDACCDSRVRGHEIANLLKPDDQDYFVLKPKHSGFYSTTLDLLLQYLGARTLILCGMAGDICVLFTANDAYMRDFNIIVPCDGLASQSEENNTHAVEIMQRVLKAQTSKIEELDLPTLLK